MDRAVSDEPARALAAAKDRIATAALCGLEPIEASLGPLSLRAHQQTAVARLLEIIARFGGALLADAVGLGKTYVALAIARKYERPVVICPAALRPMWTRAIQAVSLDFPILAVESLARGRRPNVEPDLLIIDEAHHLRTPTTHRYDAVASLARRARVLLLTATPLQNSRKDLTAVLALFAGSGVAAWSDRELSRLIVRRNEEAAKLGMPCIEGPHSLVPDADDECLDDILALPLAVPAADEGVAAALAAISLVHLWSSSRAALHASLRKRRARAIALRDAAASGHLPTSSELAAWHYADDALQLAFPFCVSATGPEVDAASLVTQIERYIDAVAALLRDAEGRESPDIARVSVLRTLRATHPGARIVAFSQYAQTVTALGNLMRTDSGVAVITGERAQIASGTVTRAEVLAQFALDAPPTAPVERVDLLLSTDILSEGVDLRAASVIVHLDLPWNPARLEQRVGRTRRMGSPHDSIHVYSLVPPASADRMLALRRQLARKIRMADGVIGSAASALLEERGPIDASRSPVASAEALRTRLAGWMDPAVRCVTGPIVAAACAERGDWIAAVQLDGPGRLIYSIDGIIGDDPEVFAALMESLSSALPATTAATQAAMHAIATWGRSRRAVGNVRAEESYPPSKRAVLDRLIKSVARAPRHRRAGLVAAAQKARDGISDLNGIGVERILAELAQSAADDESWVRSVEAFATAQHRDDPGNGNSRNSGSDQKDTALGLEALILLVQQGAA